MILQKLLKRKRKAMAEGNKVLLASTCVDLAELYLGEARYEEAVDEYQIVAEVYKTMGKHLDAASAYRMIGEAYTHLREYDKALHHQQTYLDVAKNQNNKLEEQRALATVGHTYLTIYLDIIDNPDKSCLNLAHQSFKKSLAICESLTGLTKREYMDMTARLYANLGIVNENLGNYEIGINLLEQSIKICKSHDLFEQLEMSYTFLGALFVRSEEYKKALDQYNLAIDLANRLKNKKVLKCTSLAAKADILIKLADFQEAKNVLFKAYKLKTPNTTEQETIEHNLKVVAAMCYSEKALLETSATDYNKQKKLYETMGDGASDLKNYVKSIEYYQRMLEAAEKSGTTGKDLSPCYISLAQTYSDNKQYDLALKYFKKEYELHQDNVVESLSTLLSMANTVELSEKDFDEVKQLYNLAINKCRAAGENELEVKVIKRYILSLKKKQQLNNIIELEQRLTEIGYESSEGDESEDENTPDIGYMISIFDLTDISDNSDEEVEKPRTSRRTKGISMKKNEKGESPLHVASINGNVALVRQLLHQGHVVNVRDYCGWLPLHEACIYGHLEIVQMLIENGAAINDRGGKSCNGVSPLHDAASNGHLDVIEYLLDHGASPVAKTNNGETPLHILMKWRQQTTLDNVQQSMYENIASRLKEALEKSGHDVSFFRYNHVNISVTKEKSNEVFTEDVLEIRSRRVNKELGSLRKQTNEVLSNEGEELQSNNATNEYKQVMENLRRKSSQYSGTKRKHLAKQPALIETSDDWLEDDLNLNAKKRKKYSDPFASTSEMSPTKTTSFNNVSNEDLDIPLSFFEDDDNFNNTVIENRKTITLSDYEDNPTIAPMFKKKSQSSLLNAGFNRTRSSSPTTIASGNSEKNMKTPKQSKLISLGSITRTYSCHQEPEINTSPILTHSMLTVDVRIDGRLFRIPVPLTQIQTLTIKWLAEEASKRYCKKECMKPLLELETKNGAVLADDDFVCILFSMGQTQAEEVQAKILKWNTPPIADRYKEACENMNEEFNEALFKVLQETSTCIDLSNRGYRSQILAPFCKALNRENNLQSLNLSGNFIMNDCVQLLCASLPSLDNLACLNLSLNHLFTDSLKQLADMFMQSNKTILENLITLDLSYNSLSDESLKYLAVITRYLKLHNLFLIDVGFTSNIFTNYQNKNIELCFDYVKTLDLSHNQLSKSELLRFVSYIKPELIENLNFSYNNVEEEGLTTGIVQIFHNIEKLKLKELDLTDCNVNESELYELLKILIYADDFDRLNLGFNEKLTGISLRRLLQSTNRIRRLDLTGCGNILKYFKECSDSLWTNISNGNDLKMKSLKLSVDYNSNLKECDVLINFFKNINMYKSNVVMEVQNFLELSIKD